MEVKHVSLDDLLSPEDLAKVKAKRGAKTDLSDLITPRVRPPDIEVLEAVQVIFFSQINTCLNCKREMQFPTGLVAMHKIKRHGRTTNELAGIALTEGNQHPHLERQHQTTSSTSIVCSECVDQARFVVTPTHNPPIPVPGTSYWNEQFGWGNSAEIHSREEAWERRQELINRELAEGEARIIPPQIEDQARELQVSEAVEYTLPEDSQ